jgi:transcriptional regulator with XRE-family HTH domain
MTGFGRLIRSRREERGLTLADIAGEVGISIAYLSRIERDREHPPRDELIRRMAEALGLPEDEAFAAARRLPPDLQARVGEVIAAYRRSTGRFTRPVR